MSDRGWDNTGGSGAEASRPPDFVADVAPAGGVPPAPPPRVFGESVGTDAPQVGGSPAGGSGANSTATVATEQARQVASTAGEGAKEVAGEVRTQAAQVAGEARNQALGAMRSAQEELRGHASQQTDRAAQGLHGFAGQIQALVEGRTDEAGMAGDYARQAGDKIRQVAGRLEDGGFDGVVDDVRRFAQRRPGLFLIGAAAAGFAAGRMIRASRGGDDQDDLGGGTYRMAADAGRLDAGLVDPAGMGYPPVPAYGADGAPSGYEPVPPVAPLVEGDALLAGTDVRSQAPGGAFDTGIR